MDRRSPSLPAFALAVALCWAALPAAAAPSFAYRVTVDPQKPVPGSPLVVDVKVDGLSGAELGDLSLGPGLYLESSLVKPWLEAGKPAGSELRLEFSVLDSGPWSIDSIELVGQEGRFLAGPMRWEAAPAGTVLKQSWRWDAPATVYRYSSIAVRLVGSPPPGVMPLAFVSAPVGASLEPIPGEAMTWVLTPLEGRTVTLPETRIDAGEASGKAPALRIAVLSLPAEVAATRAVGEFGLSLEGPGPGSFRAGELLSFRLALRGQGNLPSLRFPTVNATLDGKALPAAVWRESRADSIAPTLAGYEGAAVVDYLFEAPGAGTLHVEPAPFPVLLPGGIVENLRVPALDLRILPKDASGGGTDPLGSLIPRLAEILAKRETGLAALPRLLKSADKTAAAKLLSSAPPPVSMSTEGRLLAAALLWSKGAKGEALALLYGLARQEPGNKDVALAAASTAAFVNAGKPFADALPKPRVFLLPGAAAFVAGLSLLVLSVLRRSSKGGRSARFSPLLAAVAGLLLIAALSLGGLAAASSLERHRSYAVVWADRLYSVPSTLSEGTLPLARGASAEVVGKAPGYVGLRLEDGTMGWAKEESVFTY
jgi:hypothetical protein